MVRERPSAAWVPLQAEARPSVVALAVAQGPPVVPPLAVAPASVVAPASAAALPLVEDLLSAVAPPVPAKAVPAWDLPLRAGRVLPIPQAADFSRAALSHLGLALSQTASLENQFGYELGLQKKTLAPAGQNGCTIQSKQP